VHSQNAAAYAWKDIEPIYIAVEFHALNLLYDAIIRQRDYGQQLEVVNNPVNHVSVTMKPDYTIKTATLHNSAYLCILYIRKHSRP
jgi:hypothetical protein